MDSSIRLSGVRVFIGRNLHSADAAIAGSLVFEGPPPPFDPAVVRHRLRHLLSQVPGAAAAPPLTGDVEGRDWRQSVALLIGWFAGELQNLTGAGVTTFATDRDFQGTTLAVCGYQEPTSGRAAMMLSAHLVASVVHDEIPEGAPLPGPARHALANLMDLGTRAHFNVHVMPFVVAAEARNIPLYPVRWPHPLMQLGQGARQRHFVQVMGDGYDHVGTMMCRDKELSNAVLRRIGVPVPEQRRAESLQQAKRVAAAIGYPVVVKPGEGHGGKGVVVDIRDPAALEPAFDAATAVHAGTVLVEKFVPGGDHRLLLLDGKLIAAAKRIAGHVVGDGTHSVAELMAIVNQDPRRGVGVERLLVRLNADADAERVLAKKGYDLATVPAAGEVVFVRATANVSTGGTAVDVLDKVHPSVREMAEIVARAFKVRVMAIDYLTTDISRPASEACGVVCEVNESPGLRPHALAGTDISAIMDAVLDGSFGPGETGRIPIAAITGTSGKTTTARMVTAMLEAAGVATGLACSDGVFVGARRLRAGDSAGAEAARMALYDPTVEAAVLELARGGLIRYGVPIDQADVAAVLNVSHDHLGQDGVETVEQLAAAKALVVTAATGAVVLNADDPHCRGMEQAAAAPIVWTGRRADNPKLCDHVAAGGTGVTVDGEGEDAKIVIVRGAGERTEVARLADMPSVWGGLLEANVRNAVSAVAIAHGLGLQPDAIASGLKAFRGDFGSNAGRFSLLTAGRKRIIVDRADSVADIGFLRDCLDNLPAGGRRIAALTHVGNRRDEDILAFAGGAAGGFDHYVCYDWSDLRGRQPGEVAELLASGLRHAGVGADAISTVPSEPEALAHAFAIAGPDDLLVLVMLDETEDLRPILEPLGVDRWDSSDPAAWLERSERAAQPPPRGAVETPGTVP